jgi:hypothetical protein
MVTRLSSKGARQRGTLMMEMLVALALLTGVLIPAAYSIASERRFARVLYYRAVAMEIVDGEMEVLAAGQWRAFEPGTREYTVRAGAATNLPPGRFLLTVADNKARLEWRPAARRSGGPVVREVRLK